MNILRAFLDYNIQKSPLQEKPKRIFFAGYDPAKINDRSGFCILEKMEDGTLETRMIINLQGLDYVVQVPEVIRLCKTYGVKVIAIDATAHEQVFEQIRNALGVGKVKKCCFTKDRQLKEEIVLNLRLICQNRKFKMGRNFKHYELLKKEMHELDPNKLDHPKGGSSDLFWSAALAAYASKFHYVPAGRIKGSI